MKKFSIILMLLLTSCFSGYTHDELTDEVTTRSCKSKVLRDLIVKCRLFANKLKICGDATIGGTLTVEGQIIGPSGPIVSGATGPTGATGATGATGISGILGYAYIYNEADQTVVMEDDVTFDSNGSMSPNITHVLGSADVEFADSGTYGVSFSLTGTAPNQFALFLDGTEVAGTIYGTGIFGMQQNSGQAMFDIVAGEVLTLRNHTSDTDVVLSSTGGSQIAVNASLYIEQLA